MKDLSLHILDIAEKAANAGAKKVVIRIVEDMEKDLYSISVEDDVRGMDEKALAMAEGLSRTPAGKKKPGPGIPLLKQAALECEGQFRIKPSPGKGIAILASFRRSHMGRKPLGDLGSAMLTLICGHPQTRYVLFYEKDGFRYGFDTDALTESLEGMTVNVPAVLMSVRDSINESTGAQVKKKPHLPDCGKRRRK